MSIDQHRWEVAVHESGHAVVMVAEFGATVTQLFITPQDANVFGYCQIADDLSRIESAIYSASGSAAVARAHRIGFEWPWNAGDDKRKFDSLQLSIAEPVIKYTMRLVERNWSAIYAVATQLYFKGALSHTDVVRAIERTNQQKGLSEWDQQLTGEPRLTPTLPGLDSTYSRPRATSLAVA